MKIGIDCRIYGGTTDIGRYTEDLVTLLSRDNGADEYILFFSASQLPLFESPHERIRKVSVNAPIFSLMEQTVFLGQLYRERLDVMHFMGYFAPIGYLRPSVVTIHDLLPYSYPDRRMAGSFARRAYQVLLRSVTSRARCVLVPSQHVAHGLSEVANVSEEKIEIVPYSADLIPYDAAQGADSLAKYLFQQGIGNKYLLFVGDVTEHANIARFLRAVSRVREMDDTDIVIAGWEDPGYHEVREALIECGLQKRVHILGAVERSLIRSLYHGAFAVFSPSLYEGSSYALLDSAAYGTPIVCSDIP